jgi:hypothetical protein
MDKKYIEYLNSPDWKYIRRIVLKRDHKKCTKCGSDKKLRVHHTTYEHIFNELNYLIDLITLCDDCHKITHNIVVPVHPIKKDKPTKARKPRRQRLPKSERKILKRVIVHSETATEYKVRIISLNMIWTFKKHDCKITKTTRDDNGNYVFTFQFPLSIWKEIMKENRKKWEPYKHKVNYGRK